MTDTETTDLLVRPEPLSRVDLEEKGKTELMTILFEAVDEWEQLQSRTTKAMNRINSVRTELKNRGISISLDAFDRHSMPEMRATSVVPPVDGGEIRRQATTTIMEGPLAEVISLETSDEEVDTRSAMEIHQESRVQATEQSLAEQQREGDAIGQGLERAIMAGLGAVDGLEQFTPGREGSVETRGFTV